MTVTPAIFDAPDLDGSANQLAEHMPQGRVWEAKRVAGSQMRGLVRAMATPNNLNQQLIETLMREININQTTLLIDEWEESVGLPDECFGQITDIVRRRQLVIDRLRKTPIVTLAEMQVFVNSFLEGITVTLRPGKPYYSLPYRLPQRLVSNVAKRFILVVEVARGGASLPYHLPQRLTRSIDTSSIRCLLEKVAPANVRIEIELRS